MSEQLQTEVRQEGTDPIEDGAIHTASRSIDRGSGQRLLLAMLLLLPVASIGAAIWLLAPLPKPRPAPAARTAAPEKPTAVAPAEDTGKDPNLPNYGGTTRKQAAQAIDEVAGAPIHLGVATLANSFLGTPYGASTEAAEPTERLRLDLSQFYGLRFVEAALALANSRDVRTKSEAVDRFSDHVRQLRYRGGLVNRCDRLDDPGLWAASAIAKGYLVDVSQLNRPGAPPVPLLSWFAVSGKPSAAVQAGLCQAPAAPSRISLPAVVPLASLPRVLPALRSGDLFVLVGRSPTPRALAIGVLDRQDGSLKALLADPKAGEVARSTLPALARETQGSVGFAFLRPVAEAGMRTGR